jgi:phage tail tube protein FII
MPAQTIDEVISQLQAIVTNAIATNSRGGYFAALYLKVTTRVKEGIQAGEFEDGARMEMFDVTFANRYIAAHRQWLSKQQPTAAWKLAFEMLEKPQILVLQHLMLGMNAHINLDLGIAVVELSKSQNKPLQEIHSDFNSINTILSALTYQVISELNQISPLLSLAGLHSQNDSLFIQFAMGNARDGAWCFAEDLVTKEGESYAACISQRDADMAKLGNGIVDTKGLLKITMFIIYLFEMKSPAKITGILNSYQKAYLKVNK